MSKSETLSIQERLANDPMVVDATPTKEFFVDTITRDIPLDRAIADLVDNCIDGAKRLRDGNRGDQATPSGGDHYAGLQVDLIIEGDGFSIVDNCGGMGLETARRYAFKFGRSKMHEETPNSVGQFGVGMKRALFKMGRFFSVNSADAKDDFEIEVDVREWLREELWDFRIKSVAPNGDDHTIHGTTIRVWDLYPGVSELFSQKYFHTLVGRRIKTAQQHFMRNGLAITLNGEALIADDWQLQSGAGIEPVFQRFEDVIDGNPPVKTRLYAGVSSSAQARAGWYIFCNGRCIVEADQSTVTGWGDVAGPDGVNIPRYHNQFSRFRGYAYLDCPKSEKLPWNTTKTHLDLEDPAYRLLYGRLVSASRSIINFLNDLDRENDFEKEDKALTEALSQSKATPITQLPERAAFVYSPQVRRGPVLKPISYKRPEPQIAELREKLEARNNKEVGEKSFEYAYQRLVAEDDL